MEQVLFEFVDTLDRSLKKLPHQLGLSSGFSTLTINQLHYVDAISRLGEPTITAVAEYLHITKPSVTVAINKLIKLGFVQKNRSSDDKRVYHVCLTQSAHVLVEARFQLLHQYGQLIRLALSEDEAHQFEATIRKIIQLFDENNDLPILPGKDTEV